MPGLFASAGCRGLADDAAARGGDAFAVRDDDDQLAFFGNSGKYGHDRVDALLRRAQMYPDRRLVVGGTELDRETLTLRSGAYLRELTYKEFRLLFKLAANAGRIVTRPQLMDDAWGADAGTEEHSLDVHISRLRRRLQNTGLSIVTVRGLGYKIVPQDGSARP